MEEEAPRILSVDLGSNSGKFVTSHLKRNSHYEHQSQMRQNCIFWTRRRHITHATFRMKTVAVTTLMGMWWEYFYCQQNCLFPNRNQNHTLQNVGPHPHLDYPSRLPCSVFCICQLTEQEVVTPYTRRNFVNGTSTARKGLFDWFFLQKRHLIYMSPAQKQLTGRKMVKNPPKKVFFFQTLRPAGWVCP